MEPAPRQPLRLLRALVRTLVVWGLVGWLLGAVAVGTVTLTLWWTGEVRLLWELFSDREQIQQTVQGAGLLASAVYVLLFIVQAVVAPLPAPAVAVAGGYTFGTFEGFVLTWLGALLGGVGSFALSRKFGRRFLVGSDRVRRLDRYAEEHGAFMIFLLRLIPLVSFDAISYTAGLSGISFRKFLLATAFGMAPGTFVFVYLGGASPGWGIYAALGGLAVLAAVAYVLLRRYLGHRSR